MKTLYKFSLLIFAAAGIWGCEKEQEMAILNAGAAPVVTLSANEVTLNKDNAAGDALTVSWETDYGYAAVANSTVLIDKKGGDFSKAVSVPAGSAKSKTLKVAELNALLIGLGLVPGTAGNVDIRITSTIGSATTLLSVPVTLKATAYSAKLDLSSTWGIVGSAANDWGKTPDLPLYKTDVSNVFVGYVTLTDGEIKFRQNNEWVVDYGGSGGILKAGGDNIKVTKGTYKVTFNPVALTYKIEAYSWGVVGSAANDWGKTPDLPLEYDPTVDLWRGIVTLTDGEIKFRQNNAWDVSYGGAAGVLNTSENNNIKVTKGTYLITADFKNLKYTITKYAPWGIVGDATATGWGDKPDQKFTYDLSTETWVLNNVVLKDGQIKFRLNDDWGANLGSTAATEPDPIAASGPLKDGGKNFGVKAGTYNFELNVKDSANPTYKATKIK